MSDGPHPTAGASSSEDERAPLIPKTPPPPEDEQQPTFAEGGREAWLAVLGAFGIQFSTFGYATSYGAYETYYSGALLRDRTPSEIALVGSVQTWALLSAGAVSGPLADRFGLRAVLWPGAAAYALAVLGVGSCGAYWQLLLCQGLLVGVSAGAVFVPCVSAVAHYFRRRRGLAMALASAGSPLGGVVFPLLLGRLLHGTDIGFRWSQRAVAALVAVVLLGCCACFRPGARRRSGPLILLSAFRIPAYTLQVCAMVFLFLGVFTPYVFLAEYGVRQGMPEELATYMFAIMNAGSFLGRMLGGLVSLRLGPFNVMVLASFLAATSLFLWLCISSTPALVVFAAAYGALSGVLIGIMIATLGHSAPHPGQVCYETSFAYGRLTSGLIQCLRRSQLLLVWPLRSWAPPRWPGRPSQVHSSRPMEIIVALSYTAPRS